MHDVILWVVDERKRWAGRTTWMNILGIELIVEYSRDVRFLGRSLQKAHATGQPQKAVLGIEFGILDGSVHERLQRSPDLRTLRDASGQQVATVEGQHGALRRRLLGSGLVDQFSLRGNRQG